MKKKKIRIIKQGYTELKMLLKELGFPNVSFSIPYRWVIYRCAYYDIQLGAVL